MGSSKSMNNANIVMYFLRYMNEDEFGEDYKDMIDDLLQLFMVLFLKSDEAVKVSFLIDLTAVFQSLKENATKIFVDRSFTYSILFFRLNYFTHCLKTYNKDCQEGKNQPMCPILTHSFKTQMA